MNKNYYQILEIPRGATEKEVKAAYRTKATQWHPEKYVGKDKESANTKFRDIAEAYEVLSDARLRALFDHYGEEGLKRGVSDNTPGGDVSFAGWSLKKKPEEVFLEFFATSNPHQADVKDIFESFEASKQLRKAEPIVHNLYCSLEEFYLGCTKPVKITRQKLSGDGKEAVAEEKVHSIHIHAGWKHGTKVTFPNAGDEAHGIIPADVTYALQEKPHPHFRRQGNNLVYTASVSLRQALTGCVIDIVTLDGRTLPIPITDVVR